MSENDTSPISSPDRSHEAEANEPSSRGDNNKGEVGGDSRLSDAPCVGMEEGMDTDMPPPESLPGRNSNENMTIYPSYNHRQSKDTIIVDQSRNHRTRGDSLDIREHDVRGHGDNKLDRESPAFDSNQRNLPIRNHPHRNFDFGAPALRDPGNRDHSISGPGGRDPNMSKNEPPRQPMKVRKKPGPPKTVAPPIKKNDIEAKKALIREIEGHWGEDFIKRYIPKIHRPLVKRKQGKPRSINRKVQDDPVEWMPSVLKAVLMIAKICDDKVKLKAVMGDVVRYRNQHTGNKKPQLVTTDFDVIEDMLTKGWPVETSFGIRYKHLLQHRLDDRTDTQEKNDYYKRLFRDSDDSDEDGDDEERDGEEKDDEEKDDEDSANADGGLSNDFQLQSGYYEPPPEQRPKVHHDFEHEQERFLRDYADSSRQSGMNSYGSSDPYGYGAAPSRFSPHMEPHNHHGNLMRYGKNAKSYSQGGYRDNSQDLYDSNAGSKQHRGRIGDFQQNHAGRNTYSRGDRASFQEPGRRSRLSSYNMGPPRRSASPTDHRRHDRLSRHSMESYPDAPRANARKNQSQSQQALSSTVIKAEPREESSVLSSIQNRRGSRSTLATPTNNLSEVDVDMETEDPEYIRARMEANEAQARAAKLRMKLMEMKRKKQRLSGTLGNPVDLE